MKIPHALQNVLTEYIELLNKQLPNELEGIYIQSSIALNAYVDEQSDIDFLTVTKNRMTEKNLETLSFIHSELANKFTKPEMDGVYMTNEEVGKLYESSKDLMYKNPYYNNGILSYDHYFNFNPITWWVFKENGINIMGPEPAAFKVDVHTEQLKTYVLNNMNSYWANRIQTVENSQGELMNLPTIIITEEIEWTVLGLLRQFYTLRERRVISKMGAGEYGLQHNG